MKLSDLRSAAELRLQLAQKEYEQTIRAIETLENLGLLNKGPVSAAPPPPKGKKKKKPPSAIYKRLVLPPGTPPVAQAVRDLMLSYEDLLTSNQEPTYTVRDVLEDLPKVYTGRVTYSVVKSALDNLVRKGVMKGAILFNKKAYQLIDLKPLREKKEKENNHA